MRDPVGKVVGYTGLDRIGQTLAPVLLRRRKDEVLDQLPGRIDNNVFVPMTDLQREYHTENMEIVARIVQKWRRYRFLSEADQRRLMIALQRMRMSCDSSYLLDHKNDQGKKPDEAVELLDELFEQPGTKAVVFSQWLGMHELLRRRLTGRKWEHVLFHGGVPGPKRKDLVDRFRDDPNCRAFLSTDAGGVGLNLQHASIVLNMDLPWNPAVLEQRIGRVHRLGQRQPVRVVNFVAQGTIEEGMLSVLRFKKSLFAGVLDGGETEVFLGGSRLNKFMETVESATSAIPEPMAEDAAEAPDTEASRVASAPGEASRAASAPGEASRVASAPERRRPPTRGRGCCRQGWRCCSSSPGRRGRARRPGRRRRWSSATSAPARRTSKCRCRSRRCWTRRCRRSRRFCGVCGDEIQASRVASALFEEIPCNRPFGGLTSAVGVVAAPRKLPIRERSDKVRRTTTLSPARGYKLRCLQTIDIQDVLSCTVAAPLRGSL